MYICDDCETTFESALEKHHYERNGEELDPPSYHCPHCMSEFYSILEECDVCGQLKDWHTVYNNLCDDCKETLMNKFEDVLRRNFTVAELKALVMLNENENLFEEVEL